MKLLITLALALGLATSTFTPAPEAHACGAYTLPSEEDRVRWAFPEEFAQHVHKTIHAVVFFGEDTARVELRWARRVDREIGQFAWLERDASGAWKRAGLSYTRTVWLTPTTSTPRVAGR